MRKRNNAQAFAPLYLDKCKTQGKKYTEYKMWVSFFVCVFPFPKMSTRPPIQWVPGAGAGAGAGALTTHPNSLTGLLVSAAVRLLSLHPFMPWTATNLPFPTTHFRNILCFNKYSVSYG